MDRILRVNITVQADQDKMQALFDFLLENDYEHDTLILPSEESEVVENE